MSNENDKINPLAFLNFNDYAQKIVELEWELREREHDKIMEEIEKREKERNNKPYIFQQ